MIPQFIDLGLRDFLEVQEIQKEILEKRKNNLCEDTVLISQVYPVITLGRAAQDSDILVDKETLRRENVKVCRINRGGGITLHLPGQLVIYPIIDLNNLKKDIRDFIGFLEDWMIKLLSIYSIPGAVKDALPGVWVGDRKICFIGIGISKWVSFHGLSLNVSADLRFFSFINPCGLENIKVTSLKEELRFIPDFEDLKTNLKNTYQYTLEKRGYFHEVIR